MSSAEPNTETLENYQLLLDEVVQYGGDITDVEQALENSNFREKLLERVIAKHGITVVVDDERISIPYNIPLQFDLPDAKFSWWTIQETKDIPKPSIQCEGMKVQMKVFGPMVMKDTSSIVQELIKNEYRPATIDELIVYASGHSDGSSKKLVGFSSYWQFQGKPRKYPMIELQDSPRKIKVTWVTCEDARYCSFFLGVKYVPATKTVSE